MAAEWENLYQSNSRAKWPWTDLVTLYSKYKKNNPTSKIKVLEIGCGNGTNIPFFISEKVDYTGIDFSETAILRAKKNFPYLENSLFKMDFTNELPASKFDCIIDRASVTHCTTSEIQEILKKIYDLLNSEGLFFGIDWFGENHSEIRYAKIQIDNETYSEFSEGQFKNMGKVHFTSKHKLMASLSNFEVIHLQEKSTIFHFPKIENFHSYSFVARKIL